MKRSQGISRSQLNMILNGQCDNDFNMNQIVKIINGKDRVMSRYNNNNYVKVPAFNNHADAY